MSPQHVINRHQQPIIYNSTIFKTFDNDIDKWTAKIGIFGKSFNELGTDVNGAFESVINNIDNFDEEVGFWESLKNNLFSKKENDKDWIKNSLKEIISQENIDSYIAELDLDSAKGKLKDIFKWDDIIQNSDKSWQDYFDTLKDGTEKYIPDLIKNTDDLSKLTGEDLVSACNDARNATLAHNEEIKNMSPSAKAGQIALKGLAMAGNMFLMWGISEAISGAINLFSMLEEKEERATEAAENFTNSIKESQSSFAEGSKKIGELSTRYKELSKGVSDMGNNISLTDEQYTEYKNTVSELSDLMPNTLLPV